LNSVGVVILVLLLWGGLVVFSLLTQGFRAPSTPEEIDRQRVADAEARARMERAEESAARARETRRWMDENGIK
jgi:hypothetical protein